MKTLLMIKRRFSSPELAKESLDMTFAATSLEFHVSLLFLDDAIFYLLKSSAVPADIARWENSLTALFAALPFYDIQKIYVSQEAMQQRNLQVEDLLLPVISLPNAEINTLVCQYDRVLS